MTTATFEEHRRRERQMRAFVRGGPYEPIATADEVLAVPCATCGAAAGEQCNTSFPRPSFLGMVMPELGEFHTRRYLDRSGDPR